jgi:histidinol-phosphate phosphatase family protein
MDPGGIFLDRDGTINQEVNFLSTPEELELIPGSAEAIQRANQLGFKVFIVTNQSGIARGLLTTDQLEKIHTTLLRMLNAKNAHVDGVYYCPHHPESGDSPLTTTCDCRKPNTGLIERACKEFSIDRRRSFVIGDRMADVQLGNNAGMSSIIVLTGYGKEELELSRQANAHIDYVAGDLSDAMQYVERVMRKEHLPIP